MQPSEKITILEAFPNPHKDIDYTIKITIPEFTCLCPKTSQPDFAVFHLAYVPDGDCVELKSLKLYMGSYRNEGAFHEKVTNQIAVDLFHTINPRSLTLEGKFNARGGITTDVVVSLPAK